MNPTVMLALGPATQSWMVVTMAEQNTEQRQFFFPSIASWLSPGRVDHNAYEKHELLATIQSCLKAITAHW